MESGGKREAVERVKAHILTEENLTELVRLTNGEIGQARNEYEDRLAVIDGQLEDLRERLHKLYSALETGKLGVEDLAPRVKELRGQIDQLEVKRLDLVESIRGAKVELLEASIVKAICG